MRKLLTCLAIVMATLVCQASDSTLKGPGDAWPWGAEMPFPWKGIQGTWVTKIGDRPIYFRFVPVRSNSGINQLQVTEYQGLDCTVVADGVGYEQNRVVKAVMVSKAGSFVMTVHVFRQADIQDMKTPPGYVEVSGEKTVTVMSVSPIGAGPASRNTFQLSKMESDLAAFCESY